MQGDTCSMLNSKSKEMVFMSSGNELLTYVILRHPN